MKFKLPKRIAFHVSATAVMLAMITAPLNVMAADSSSDRPWMNKSLSADQRTELLLKEMTLDEKIDFVTGKVNNYYGFYNNGNDRLGIPALQMADGPAGVRIANPDVQDKKSTALPAPIALAATWDTKAASEYGGLIGNEAWNTTHNVVLGPGMDIARFPWGERNFESLGEDPLLQSKMAVDYIKGIQKSPVIATAKHFILNNQETQRFTIDAQASERALQEIYLRPFDAAVNEADIGAAMCSFNQVDGIPACQSAAMMNDILKKQMGFKGFVMSDYGANMSTVESANAGLDLETPGEPFGKWGKNLLTAVQDGKVSEERLNDMVSRMLDQMFAKGLFDKPAQNKQIPAAEHGETARELAEEGMVLLKNDNAQLPLKAGSLKSIAVIGPDADNSSAAGGGSSLVNPTYTVSPLEGIKKRAGKNVTVQYEAGTDPIQAGDILPGPSAVPSDLLTTSADSDENGLHAEYWTNTSLEGTPSLERTDKQVDTNYGFYNYEGFNASSPKVQSTPTTFNGKMSARWTGAISAPSTGDYTLTLTSLGSGKLYLDDKLLIDNQGTSMSTTKAQVNLKAGEKHTVKIEYRTDSPQQERNGYGMQVRFGWEAPDHAVDANMQKAIDLAKKSDVAVVVTRTYDSEGNTDTSTLDLPNNQDTLIRKVAEVNPHTIVVNMSGRPVQMNTWDKDVKGIVQAWFAGQEQGNAIARVLFGDVNPSGKLPVTFPVDENTTPVTDEAQFPGKDGVSKYNDDIYVGYKGYDKAGLEVEYPFGYGLSYTTFDYRNLKVQAKNNNGSHGKGNNKKANGEPNVQVDLNLRNTGKVTGSEVVQVYAGKLPGVESASKNLAGFAKVELKPGKQQRVSIQLDPKAFSYWDEKQDKWVTPSGKVAVYVGSSSRDVKLQGSVTLP
ncbi:glycoside hydrolase family 3 C-terminal domain-containing protein [Paenibacillus sp. JX-17]|uniref:Glycoside hydrolase family 3 C-terminal domain-containing protein n=1 Tax=Paenibacillus lacisoli TaxID=3064525 RepID=A0ABT9CGE7_9BACL|nr:glycoside hydrolase family 3 C-terminal domain-containing protein [Paenibacillus sp. JX-17]MDO7907643.1 glycoside hydrolase family 3 C-terminal domain-containing protein [Paenibacillus sp. JX-17]